MITRSQLRVQVPTRAIAFLALLALPVAAQASGGTPIPEAPSSLLFALGAVGVLVGRHASMRRRNRDDRRD